MSDPQFSVLENIAVPDENRITYFAVTDTRNKRTPFGIKKEDRSRHTYVIGKTGMGKSTLLENMAAQDILTGEGLCFIDPHGGTAEKLMEYIPEERIKDVLYFAPFDMQYPVSFNVLENVDADKRHLVVAGLMSTFEKIWVDAWSARMAYILQNTIASLLEFPGATLLGVNRMYIDKEYRKNVIAKITDPAVRSFWVDEYSKYTDRYAQEATPAIQNKIGQFSSNALVRNVIGQEQSAFNIRDLMDQKKIFIVNLSKGRVGEGNANLLGSMLITKIYLAAMSRADVASGSMRSLPPFYLYVDEFQNFANKSFADILSEARKYKLSLTVAHQYIEQMEEEVRAAVFGNVGTMITFRVGAYDAEVLEKEFSPTFTAEDLVNLGSRQIYLKLMIDGVSSHPFSAATLPPIPEPEVSHRDRAIAFSRAQFSRPREEVETDIREWVSKKYEDPEAEQKEMARQERRMQKDVAEGTQRSFVPQDRPRSSRPLGEVDRRPSFARARPEGGQPFRSTPTPRPASTRPYEREAPLPTREQVRTYVAPPSPPSSSGFVPRPPRDTTSPAATRRPFTPPRPLPPEKKQESMADLRSVLAKMATPKEAPPSEEATPATSTPPPPLVSPPPQAPPAPPATKHFHPARDDGKGVTEAGKQQLRDLLTSLQGASSTEKKPTQNPSHPSTPPQAPPAQSVRPPTQPAGTANTPSPTHTSVLPRPQSPPPRIKRSSPPYDTSRTTPVPTPSARQQSQPVVRAHEHPTHVPVERVSEQGLPLPSHQEETLRQHDAPDTPAEIPVVDLRHMLHVDKPDLQ